jgi:class 3 adenylate cyclase
MPPLPAGPAPGTATILFTDLVGSTMLRTALGEDRAEAHRQAHHRLLGDTIDDVLARLLKADTVAQKLGALTSELRAAMAMARALRAAGHRASSAPAAPVREVHSRFRPPPRGNESVP